MSTEARTPEMFTVCMLGVRPRPYAGQRYTDYKDAERQAKDDVRETLCDHDIYLGNRLVATVCSPSFAGKIKVDLTELGSRFV
ncbi:hypothetical protein [Gluconobacter sp. GP1]|uniref:hypothetical protein n=1 Tax=Gluconobacter sp. GP1 TaxID=3046423 RepID=UPI00293E3925|nr:hypothetical protein [Gluconobacter sp. GP1]